MSICSRCSNKILAKGLCRKHYYYDKTHSSDQKDIETYVTKQAERAARRYSEKTPEQRLVVSRNARSKARELLLTVVPNVCALRELSPCSVDTQELKQDHCHHCDCGKRTGCQKCFRGLLCHRHNRVQLPILEKLNPEHIPQIVSKYLLERPLIGTNIHPFAR
jgi:hypothetical protein